MECLVLVKNHVTLNHLKTLMNTDQVQLTEQQIARGRRFCQALRDNPVKCKRWMRDPLSGGRCCLAVALDTAIKDGFDPPMPVEHFISLPPEQLKEWYGWDNRNPTLTIHGQPRSASYINDGILCGEEITHKQIAELFENAYPQLRN